MVSLCYRYDNVGTKYCERAATQPQDMLTFVMVSWYGQGVKRLRGLLAICSSSIRLSKVGASCCDYYNITQPLPVVLMPHHDA